jgi:predicted nucleic acid-binding protein
MRSYIDANVIVEAYTSSPNNSVCRARLDKGLLATSSIAVVEAWNALIAITGATAANKSVIDLLRRDVDVIPSDSSLIHDAVRNQQRFKLDAFDAVHLTAAQKSGCVEILTFDKDLLSVSTEPPSKEP